MTVGSAAVIAPRSFRSLRPSADWVWDWDWVWVTLGTRLDHPCVSHASRLGDPWVEWNKWFCLQQKMEKAGWGCAERAYRRHRNRKTFPQQPAIYNLSVCKSEQRNPFKLGTLLPATRHNLGLAFAPSTREVACSAISLSHLSTRPIPATTQS